MESLFYFRAYAITYFCFIYYFATLTVLPIYIMQDLGGSVKEAG